MRNRRISTTTAVKSAKFAQLTSTLPPNIFTERERLTSQFTSTLPNANDLLNNYVPNDLIKTTRPTFILYTTRPIYTFTSAGIQFTSAVH